MGTEDAEAFAELLSALSVQDWSELLEGVAAAEAWLRQASPGDPRRDELATILTSLASHPKWEIRRRIANVAAQAPHRAFESALFKLRKDDNARVREAAERASVRRRDWQNASALGKQHEERINATLDDIEARFGLRGREAVKRVGVEVANTFARELYHEMVKVMAPLAMSAERLQGQLLDDRTGRTELINEATRIARRVDHLNAVLNAMRAYTQPATLTFATESLKELVEEAAALVREVEPGPRFPSIHIQVEPSVVAEVCRSRLLQALRNVLTNAVEAYESVDDVEPIVVRAEALEGRIVLSVEDRGCGMSEEVLADSTVLFSTSKTNGTGFGLPLAIKIIESEHRGRLTLDSAPERGTTVRIVIPTLQDGGRL